MIICKTNWFYNMSGEIADRINSIMNEQEKQKEINNYEKCIDDLLIPGNRSKYRSKCCNSVAISNIISSPSKNYPDCRYIICMNCGKSCEVNKNK